jgi:predicted phage tail component-like protein
MISFSFTNNSGLQFNSLTNFGIYLSEKPALPRAERNFRYTEIEGKHGSLTEDIKTYKDIKIELNCWMLNTDIPNNVLDNLNNWLNGEGGILTFSYLSNKYFKVKEIKDHAIKESSGIFGEFEVTLICEPFRYLTSGLNTTTLTTTPTTINNIGTLESKPYIKVYGDGNITLIINGLNVVLNNVVSYLEIDSEMEEVFVGTNLVDQMLGEFPVLKVGSNSISWSGGTVTKIEIIPKWRCL